MTCHSLEDQLTVFREAYHSIKCWVGSDSIIYKCARGASDRAVVVANDLIRELNLDLVAISTSWASKDSYIVQSIYNSEI